MTPPLSPRPGPRPDSVPPLAATMGAVADPARPRRIGSVRVALLLCLCASGALAAYARFAPHPSKPYAQARLRALAVSPPPPITPALADEDIEPETLEEQRKRLFQVMKLELSLSDDALKAVEDIFSASPVLGQGNPAATLHPMARSECRRIRLEAGLERADEPLCGAKGMAPLYNPAAGETAKDAKACIDEFEFPDVPCEYPVVHVRASEAAALCRAVGKRICDAHEWEGACAGALRSPDVEYEWGRPRGEATWYHNFKREKVWSYGPTKNHALCGTQSYRSPDCPGGGYEHCGSNTYPSGAFPACKSPLGAFDMHGNAAEHMNLPILPTELARYGDGGFTEMKGSWFVFQSIEAHEDDCRWRAPSWHETRTTSPSSHANYHLGFRCCSDVRGSSPP